MGKSLVSCFLTYSVQYISFHSTVRQTFEAVSGRTGELLWTEVVDATVDSRVDAQCDKLPAVVVGRVSCCGPTPTLLQATA